MMLSIHLGGRLSRLEEYISSHGRTLVPLGGKLHTYCTYIGIGMFDGVALKGTTFTLDAIHDP